MANRTGAIDLIIRLILIGVLSTWCLILLRPFIGLILWAGILAIAIYPVFLSLKTLLGGRAKLSGTLLTLLGVLIIVGPVSVLATLLVGNVQDIASNLQSGTLDVPSPPDGVKDWPVIGPSVNQFWELATDNLRAFLGKFRPQLQSLAKNLLVLAAGISLTLLKFLISIIIAGLLTLNAEHFNVRLTKFFVRLTPSQGEKILQLATATIRGVSRGIIGVALLQSLMVGIGFMAAGIPAAGLLTLVSLVLAIIQIGPGLVVIPTIIYAWSSLGMLMALLFTLWMIPALVIDNVLKPILMAKGLPIPIVVILIGVFGGTITHGILGLFIGPVILGLGYEILRVWVNSEPQTT